MEEQLILYVRYTAKPGCRESFVRDIVEDCGINRNSFYYHFQDIPSLLGEIVTEQTDELIRQYPTISSM